MLPSPFSSFTLISAHTFTHCHSLFSTQGWNWAPYLLHCPLNDTLPHWDEDATQDGHHRPKHSSGYQPAPPVTASHGGVRFSLCVRLSAGSQFFFCLYLWCVLVCAACLVFVSRQQQQQQQQWHRQAVASEELREKLRPGKGTDTSGRRPGTSYHWSYITKRRFMVHFPPQESVRLSEQVMITARLRRKVEM